MPFSPIQLPSKMPEGAITFDIFVYFKNQYLCFRKAGQNIGDDILQKLKNQNISLIYISSEHLNEYYKLMRGVLESVISNKDSYTDEQKMDILSLSASNSMEQISRDPNDKLSYSSTTLATKGIVEMVLVKPAILKTFFDQKHSQNEIFIHSKNVSLLSVALGKKAGLKVEVLLNLAIASLLHDLSHVSAGKSRELGLFATPRESISKEQLHEYKKHGEKTVSLLQGQEKISPPIAELIANHEYSLAEKVDLSMAGQVLSLANVFDKQVTMQKSNPIAAYKDIQISEMGNYDLKLVSFLADILNVGGFKK